MTGEPETDLNLTHLFSMHPFSNPENIRKPYGFWMFQGVEKECIANKCVNFGLKSKSTFDSILNLVLDLNLNLSEFQF